MRLMWQEVFISRCSARESAQARNPRQESRTNSWAACWPGETIQRDGCWAHPGKSAEIATAYQDQAASQIAEPSAWSINWRTWKMSNRKRLSGVEIHRAREGEWEESRRGGQAWGGVCDFEVPSQQLHSHAAGGRGGDDQLWGGAVSAEVGAGTARRCNSVGSERAADGERSRHELELYARSKHGPE